MEIERTYYIGVVSGIIEEEGITKEYGIIEADIPGVCKGIRAFPKRSELSEPKEGDAILLTSLDPVLNSYWIYEKLKENDFIGIRAAGKMIDITPDYIGIGVFDPSEEYGEDERPEMTSYIKIDNSGNIEIKAAGNNAINIDGNTEINASGDIKINTSGDTEIKTTGNTNIESELNCTVKAMEVKITGGILSVNGNSAPTGTGPFCAIPICPISGLPHIGNQVAGT